MGKYSKEFERDYSFFYKNRNKFTFSAQYISAPEFDKKGCSAKKYFFLLDSRGIDYIKTNNIKCSEPELFVEIYNCKKSINFQIMQYGEGHADTLSSIDEYVDEFIDPPEWVKNAIQHQINKNWHKVDYENIIDLGKILSTILKEKLDKED